MSQDNTTSKVRSQNATDENERNIFINAPYQLLRGVLRAGVVLLTEKNPGAAVAEVAEGAYRGATGKGRDEK